MSERFVAEPHLRFVAEPHLPSEAEPRPWLVFDRVLTRVMSAKLTRPEAQAVAAEMNATHAQMTRPEPDALIVQSSGALGSMSPEEATMSPAGQAAMYAAQTAAAPCCDCREDAAMPLDAFRNHAVPPLRPELLIASDMVRLPPTRRQVSALRWTMRVFWLVMALAVTARLAWEALR